MALSPSTSKRGKPVAGSILKWARASHGRPELHAVRCKYVGVEKDTGTELFYYFVESERSPGTDPVILWLTGGPGCLGFSGMVFEVG
uniref:Uncharacterized protein n=1 Tax=Aegilops tauschii subsp. strangulata TaxID=200361 RepID=A0A453HAQ4_AEGTS